MKIIFWILILIILFFMVQEIPSAASMLGVSVYSATKIVDAIFLGLSAYTILALIAAGGGFAAIALGTLRYMVRN